MVKHAGDEFDELRLGGVGRGDNAVDIGGLKGVGEAQVGDDAKADDRQTAVARDKDFRNGRHADGVGPDLAEKTVFGARLQVGTHDGDEDALVGDEILAPCNRQGGVDQLAVVRLAHIGKARAEAIVVDADERGCRPTG